MKKLGTVQRIIFILGILGIVTGTYGKWQGWEHNDYFELFYTGISFIWISFLDTKNKSCNPFKKWIFKSEKRKV